MPFPFSDLTTNEIKTLDEIANSIFKIIESPQSLFCLSERKRENEKVIILRYLSAYLPWLADTEPNRPPFQFEFTADERKVFSHDFVQAIQNQVPVFAQKYIELKKSIASVKNVLSSQINQATDAINNHAQKYEKLFQNTFSQSVPSQKLDHIVELNKRLSPLLLKRINCQKNAAENDDVCLNWGVEELLRKTNSKIPQVKIFYVSDTGEYHFYVNGNDHTQDIAAVRSTVNSDAMQFSEGIKNARQKIEQLTTILSAYSQLTSWIDACGGAGVVKSFIEESSTLIQQLSPRSITQGLFTSAAIQSRAKGSQYPSFKPETPKIDAILGVFSNLLNTDTSADPARISKMVTEATQTLDTFNKQIQAINLNISTKINNELNTFCTQLRSEISDIQSALNAQQSVAAQLQSPDITLPKLTAYCNNLRIKSEELAYIQFEQIKMMNGACDFIAYIHQRYPNQQKPSPNNLRDKIRDDGISDMPNLPDFFLNNITVVRNKSELLKKISEKTAVPNLILPSLASPPLPPLEKPSFIEKHGTFGMAIFVAGLVEIALVAFLFPEISIGLMLVGGFTALTLSILLTLDVAGIEMEIEEENNREVEDFSPSLAPQDEKKEKQRYDEMYSLISQVIESPLPIQNSNPPSTDKERLEIN